MSNKIKTELLDAIKNKSLWSECEHKGLNTFEDSSNSFSEINTRIAIDESYSILKNHCWDFYLYMCEVKGVPFNLISENWLLWEEYINDLNKKV